MDPRDANGLSIERRFTREGISVFDQFEFEKRDIFIVDPFGNIVFLLEGAEVPARWSKLAGEILAQKYFRKKSVPGTVPGFPGETSVKQVVHRIADCWKDWGFRYGYFKNESAAQAFYDEVVYMLLDQRMAPNSPQWFNTGLFSAYGIKGPAQGHYYVDPSSNELCRSSSAYERPQPHACFILSVKDDLVNPGGIMDLWLREARVFKYGSGSGANFSDIRAAGEKLSGGGTASGLISFLRIGDAAAGAIRSGGTTRRAAKMVCLDADHPEIIAFIRWKSLEEKKARVLIAAGFDADAAYASVFGQNSNNSIRLSDPFMHAYESGSDWKLIARTDRHVVESLPAKKIWDELCQAAWDCGDPGVQFDTSINQWHTCPEGGPIRASNPCSEYMFLDDTACNLGSVNLLKFTDLESGSLMVDDFSHACRLMTIALELSVLMAQFPSEAVARNSFDYRPLGLGYANLGAYFMVNGWPYDSKKACSAAAAITALMTGIAYRTSAELAHTVGRFSKYSENEDAMLNVLRKHLTSFEKIREDLVKDTESRLLEAAHGSLLSAIELGEQHGFRNAQVTAIAPTGTISLLMDCDTYGIEPEFALVRSKRMSDGTVVQIMNRSLGIALGRLGYSESRIEEIFEYLKINGHISGCTALDVAHRSVFDCASPDSFGSGISIDGHLDMMASVQPFISGAISKTVNIPNDSSVGDVSRIFLRAWKLGLKSISVYRDGSKAFQPMLSSGKMKITEHAPLCFDCGYRTVREGSCYKCVNCGATVGCS